MTDDNIIDISAKLPPDLRKLRREQMDLIRAHRDEVSRIVNSVDRIRRDWANRSLPYPGGASTQAYDLAQAITLLLCAHEKLVKTVPYTPEEIEEAAPSSDAGECK